MPFKPTLSGKYIRKVKCLYYDKGYSAKEVADKLKVSIDVVYSFMRRHGLKRRSFQESNRIRFDKMPFSYSLKKRLTEKEERLKLAGTMLYWAEGSKKRHFYKGQQRGAVVDLANSDPRMIILFLGFLRKICRVDEKRLRVHLYCYANQNVNALKKFWHKIKGNSLAQFIRPYVRQDFLPEKKDKMKYGLIHIRYSDTRLLCQILDWIEEYLKENI